MAKTTRTARKPKAEANASLVGELAPRKRKAAAEPRGDKKLVVVESPAKAKTINRYLGNDYVVKASMGHVRDLPTKEIGVDIDAGFVPTYEPLAGRRKVLAELKKIARTAGEVFLATDLDREGEAIAWHLAETLGVPAGRIRRVTFNEITATAIREAFAHPRDIDMNMVNAQQARRILDRIVGYQVSPLLWRKIATGLSAGRVQSVAVRIIVDREREIEAFIPEEYWKIAALFTPDCAAAGQIAKEWAEFLAKLDENASAPGRDAQQDFLSKRKTFRAELVQWKGAKFQAAGADATLEVAKALGLQVRELRRGEDPRGKGVAKNVLTVIGSVAGTDAPGAPRFTVADTRQRESRTRPPAPFATASLQQQAAVQLRFAASRTMRTAQQLYEGIEVPGEGSVGLITYMRTDSMHLSADSISKVRSLIAEKFGREYVPESPNFYASAERAQEAHEAVRPTDPARLPQKLMGVLTDDQYKLYDLIWKRFVACQMAAAVWKTTDVDILAKTSAGEGVFRASGRQLVFDGFFRVTGVPRGDQILPELAPPQPVAPVEISPTQHFTQPPPRYTEASLVKALEADGIGRPSTYATIIQTIQDRNYVRQVERAFHPTDLGLVVTDKLVKHFPGIFDVRFTSRMEDELDKVEENHADWVQVLREFYGPFHEKLDLAGKEMTHARSETKPSDYKCDVCGKPMVYRFSRNGRYLACTGYPDCKTTCPVDSEGRKIERVEVAHPCPVCGKTPMVLRRGRTGVFLGCTGYPECKGTVGCDKDGNPLKTVKAEEIKQTCSECGAPMAVRWKFRRAFLGCSQYPACKNAIPLPEGIRIEPPPREPPEPAGVNCPKCGRPMLIRKSRRGPFLACSGFPRCRNAMNLDKLDELKKQQAENPVAPAPDKKTAAKKAADKEASAKKAPDKETPAEATPEAES